MKTIIAGSRTCISNFHLRAALNLLPWKITEVVSGMAKGADTLGVKYAKALCLPLHEFPADWEFHGKSAGYRRNDAMARNAEACLILWNGHSKGTKHMTEMAKRAGLEVFVYNYLDHSYFSIPATDTGKCTTCGEPRPIRDRLCEECQQLDLTAYYTAVEESDHV